MECSACGTVKLASSSPSLRLVEPIFLNKARTGAHLGCTTTLKSLRVLDPRTARAERHALPVYLKGRACRSARAISRLWLVLPRCGAELRLALPAGAKEWYLFAARHENLLPDCSEYSFRWLQLFTAMCGEAFHRTEKQH